ncbi:MAG: FAD-dependent oxidoreductase [Desulfovibrio sp.]|nr:FAD-dependent oxidoreductase [Desulfovibrio sp.]
MASFKGLGQPFSIGAVQIKNRFCMAPVGGGQHHRPEGGFKDETIQYLVERARGGFGLIFTGAIATDATVDPYTGIGPAILQNPAAFRFTAIELNERAAAYGVKIFAQLTLGLGRNYPGLPAPSVMPVYGHEGEHSPALSTEQIRTKINSLIRSAVIVRDSGFAGVEVHSIHWGYLLDQFALAMLNKRTDKYGGSLANRLRAAREIVEGIKQECGTDFPVSMRLGLKTFIKDFGKATLTGEDEMGRTIEEGIEIARELESYGYDCLNVDTGTYDSFYYACPPMYMPKGYPLGLAAQAKMAVKIPILAGGRMNDPFIAEEAVSAGKIDAVVLGRAALADPDYPNKVLTGHPEAIRPCIACNQGCLTRLQQGKQPSCAVNPQAMCELRLVTRPAAVKKKIVVVGGGVAGMEAARTAARRGHEVILLEKSSALGGNLIPGGSHSFKQEVRALNSWYRRELADLPVDIRLQTAATPEMLKGLAPDVVVLATGSVPVAIDASDDAKVLGCLDALASPDRVGQKVVIIGGGLVGCEMALEYAQEGKSVTVVEALPRILSSGTANPIPNAQMIHDLFEKYGVTVLENRKFAGMRNDKAVVDGPEGQTELAADTVITAIGFKPGKSMREELSAAGLTVYEIGDQRSVADILQAVWDGFEVGNNV